MKRVLIIILTITAMLVLIIVTGCWSDAAEAIRADIAPGEAMMAEDLADVEAQEAKEQDIDSKDEEKGEAEPGDNEADKPDQSGTIVFDNTNSELGCFVQANMPVKYGDNEDKEKTLILSAGSSDMDENPTVFNITFDLDQGTITGGFTGDYVRQEEEEGAYDSAKIDANITNGTVTWDTDQGVWLFKGDVTMEVNLDIKNKAGSSGDEIFYGEANIDTNVIGELTGASGQHERLDHHEETISRGAFVNIFYEGDNPQATGNAELRFLSIECWLSMPLGEDMESKFQQSQ